MANRAGTLWAAGLVAVLLAIAFPTAGLAQAKPKRDVSKDLVKPSKKTMAAPRKNRQPAAKPHKPATRYTERPTTQAREPATTNRKTTTTPIREMPRETFLRVNQKEELSRTYPAKGEKETFQVNCNDSTWRVYALPAWCSVRRSGAFFTLTCQPNPNHEARKDFFFIRQDDRDVRINVEQEASPGRGGIASYMIWHNVTSDIAMDSPSRTGSGDDTRSGTDATSYGRVTGIITSKKTLEIKVRGQVMEPMDKRWAVLARFRYPDGTWVKASTGNQYGRYFQSSIDGELYDWAEFQPQASSNGHFEVTLKIPNETFDLPPGSQYDLQCVLQLLCESCEVKSTTRLPELIIQVTNKKGKIKTK